MDESCEHSGTMTLTPCDGDGWRILPWCFFKRKEIVGGCPNGCMYKDKPVQDRE